MFILAVMMRLYRAATREAGWDWVDFLRKIESTLDDVNVHGIRLSRSPQNSGIGLEKAS